MGQGTGWFSNELCHRLASSLNTPNTILPANMCRGPMAATTCLTVRHHLRGEYDQNRCMVSWGRNESWHHPPFNGPHIIANLMDRHAKLIVVDPRFEHLLAHKADIYLPVRPGSDGALMLSWIHVILVEYLFDKEFVSFHTNAPFLVRTDNNELLTSADLQAGNKSDGFKPFPECIQDRSNRPECLVWDANDTSPKPADTEGIQPELFGRYTVSGIECRTVLDLLREQAAQFPPEKTAEIRWTGSADKIREAVRLHATSEIAGSAAGNTCTGLFGLK